MFVAVSGSKALINNVLRRYSRIGNRMAVDQKTLADFSAVPLAHVPVVRRAQPRKLHGTTLANQHATAGTRGAE